MSASAHEPNPLGVYCSSCGGLWPCVHEQRTQASSRYLAELTEYARRAGVVDGLAEQVAHLAIEQAKLSPYTPRDHVDAMLPLLATEHHDTLQAHLDRLGRSLRTLGGEAFWWIPRSIEFVRRVLSGR